MANNEQNTKYTADVILPPSKRPTLTPATEPVVAIGTSTGGTQALSTVLCALPAHAPGIVIVQHMPAQFTAPFADRLNTQCAIEVREAKSGDRVRPGLALIAPGGRHMVMHRAVGYYYVDIVDGLPVNRHRPSVDVLFRSVAQNAGAAATGIIMTGMGDDGAAGMKEMFDAGAYTIAQDEKTCVVFGMPKVAIELGGVRIIVPLQKIPEMIVLAGRERQPHSGHSHP